MGRARGLLGKLAVVVDSDGISSRWAEEVVQAPAQDEGLLIDRREMMLKFQRHPGIQEPTAMATGHNPIDHNVSSQSIGVVQATPRHQLGRDHQSNFQPTAVSDHPDMMPWKYLLCGDGPAFFPAAIGLAHLDEMIRRQLQVPLQQTLRCLKLQVHKGRPCRSLCMPEEVDVIIDQLACSVNRESLFAGEPYDKHSKKDRPSVPPIYTDSENSVSPAISLVSLSETESDREIGQKLYESQPSGAANNRQSDVVALPRAVANLKSVDSESSSDERGNSGSRDRSKKPSPPVYKEKKPPSVTDLNINPIEPANSMDQLKLCDPFFQERHRVSRSSSNASSGICSVIVSSSETNSIESPRDTSKRSSRSSDRTSTDRASSGYASSRDSYDNPDRIRPEDYSKAHAQRRLRGKRLSPHGDPYELDPSSSEMEELDTEGASYDPKVYEDLMMLQQEMGVNLDGSDSSRESLKEMEKLSNTELLNYSPELSPKKYKVDQLSDAEKDQRCSKLMEEYKTNKKLQNVRASGSHVYRSWDL